jgi:MoaA/NifB/PqqE/SkfB family radical SAM enzyme
VQITFSGGEALMKPFTTDLVAHASSQGLFLEILTHGYWEDQGKIERLALANPWRVTISMDAIGETHTRLRGRPKFWERTSNSLNTLTRLRKEKGLGYSIRLKTVIMAQNLDEVANVTRYAAEHGMESFYQPIEQNYNTAEDPLWFEKSENWPRDTEKAVATVRQLMELKRQGLPIANSMDQLEAMIPYYRNPASMRIAVQSHVAHERRAICAATTTLQFQSNGDVTICYGQKPVGNIKTAPIRQIWENRPQWWNSGCCLERRCSVEEKEHLSLPVLQ